MKRTAETQLTKDNADSNDDIEESDGFKKADADSLATRKIKALPKRPSSASAAGLNPQIPSTKTETSGPSRFGAFSGFGTAPVNNDGGNGTLSLPSSRPLPSFSGFGTTTTATVNKESSGIRKTYQASSSSLPSPSTPIPSSSANVSTAMTSNSAQKFYTDLRGLNVSFSKAIKESIDKDPFVDLSSMIENYRIIRENIQKEYDSSKTQLQKTTSISSTTSTTLPSMPVPPAQFSFTLPPPATSTPSSSGFSWPTLAAPAAPSFSFGAPKPPSSGFFTFGGSGDGETSGSKTTTTGTANEKDKESNDQMPPGSSNSTATQSFFKPSSAPMTPGFASFLPSTTQNAKSPSMAFGSSLAANNGNIGNPVGFSFGNVTPKFSASPVTANDSSTSNDSSNALVKQEAAEDESDAGTPQNESETKEDVVNPYDKDSVGEEDEETLFETKSKAYTSITGENNQKIWAPVGVGQLKLKKKKDGTKRRLLMRNSSNGKIIINTLIVPGFKVTADGKSISFIVPNEDGTADFFKLRLTSEADAKEWEAKISEK